MKVDTTERGFEIVRFKDLDGQDCSLQQSSLAVYEQPGSGAVWLGLGAERMHLDEKTVSALVGFLSEWLSSGYFARAEKEAADLRERLKAAQVAAERRPSGRQTYAVRALEALQGAEGEWLTADELGERLGVEADRLRAPLAKLEAGKKVARMSSGAGERIYAAMIAGEVPDPPAHVLRFKAGEVSS